MILQTVNAFSHRSNETFWKVFSSHVRSISADLTFDEYVQVLDTLDYLNGETLFQKFVDQFFVSEQFRFEDNLEKVLRLARIFIKQKVGPPSKQALASSDDSKTALLTQLLGIMLKYFTLQLSLIDQ